MYFILIFFILYLSGGADICNCKLPLFMFFSLHVSTFTAVCVLRSSAADVTATFDCVFWCGDLNFRLERHRSAVERKVMQVMEPESKMHFEELLVSDQLSKYVVQGNGNST